MGWERSQHRQPARWRSLKTAVMQEHGGICHVCGLSGGDEMDHVIPQSEGGTDDPANLRPIHARPCHTTKTAQEANRARHRFPARRPPERHPGLL